MRRRTETRLLLGILAVGIGLGAAPFQGEGPPPPPNAAKAAASYYSVTKAIDDATRPWDQPDATAPPAAPGWREFFGALKSELATYAAAPNAKARATSLDRLYKLNLAALERGLGSRHPGPLGRSMSGSPPGFGSPGPSADCSNM